MNGNFPDKIILIHDRNYYSKNSPYSQIKNIYIYFLLLYIFKVSFIISQISKENEKTRIDSEIRQLDITNEKNFKELELYFANSKLVVLG